jgi:hypothetical protein
MQIIDLALISEDQNSKFDGSRSNHCSGQQVVAILCEGEPLI